MSVTYEMPRYYTGLGWATLRKSSMPIQHIEKPCAIYGWAPHMAIHAVPDGTTTPLGPIGLHTYQPKKDHP